MPRLASHIYAAHMDRVLKLASRSEGVSRPHIMDDLNVSRTIAGKLITESKLALDRKDGRTEFFKAETNGAAPAVKQSKPEVALPPEVKEAAVADPEVVIDQEDDTLAEIDAQLMDTRNSLREAAAKAGKALGDWAVHQALVDALRERMQGLATKRMNACS